MRFHLMAALITGLVSVSVFAAGGSGIMLRPAGMYWTHQWKNGAATESKTTINHYDLILGLGYRMDSGLYLGGTYTWIQEEQKNETGGSTIETKDTHTGYGPTIGYLGANLYILGTYHLGPEFVTGTDSSKDTYKGGYGYQVDFGYMFWISANVGLGPQLTYYHAEFKKRKSNAGLETDLPNTAAVSDLRPVVAFAFMF